MKETKRAMIAKAILEAIPKLDDYCDDLSRKNYKMAIRSFCTDIGTLALMDEIIEKTYLVQQFHNLKVKVLKLLDTVPEKFVKLRNLFIAQNLPKTKMAEIAGVDVRTIHRRVNSFFLWFASHLDDQFLRDINFHRLAVDCHFLQIQLEGKPQISA